MESSANYKVNVRRKFFIPGAMFGPFSFINIFSGKEALDVENGMKNMVEAAVTLRIVQLLYKECASSKHTITIAVLSPYPAQGGEVDVMIISTVEADGDECIELNRSPQNSNVDLTRARHCLWVLGDARVHLNGGSIWESLILDAKARQCFFQADEHKDLAKVIIEVKKDLHQLDVLLSGETTLFQNTTWKVFFSGNFRSSFSNIESWETKKLVLLMLLKLSTGWRPNRGSTAASVTESHYSELIKEFKVRGLHLICTIDIVKETYYYTQVLKVWDILPFHEIAELVKRLEGIIGMYTREYIDCCKARCGRRGLVSPMKWPATSEIIRYKSKANCCDENVNVRESLILMKFYSVSSGTVNNMTSGCDGGDIVLPFELTDQEKDVVSFDKSSFILGRSGTGKTTVLTMKLFQNEQLHHLACEGFHEAMESKPEVKQDVLHQLFVTFSPKLCYAVKQQFSEWKRFTCGGSLSAQSTSVSIDDIDKMMSSEDIPDHFIHLPHDAYPLIITFHRFLLMLDGTVGMSYFERFPCFRHLCSDKTSPSRVVVLERHMRSKDVTYERFCSIYWPHFNEKLTKSLDPSTVYTEIMSVIKGGLTTGEANGILSRDDYVALCDGRTSILDAQKRQIIYAIFLQYEKKKTEIGNFDLADLVIDLHQRLEVEGYKGDSIDYVYIDEVQDLSMRQIALFKYVCTNVHEGFAFCGDTAQAIAKGIGFRFEDIRCLFFNKFLLGSEKGKISKIFQLSENFRTHAGVLNLAQSIIDLLCHFFPLFVDPLRPETSRISGELPILLETDINNNAVKTIFGRKGADGSQQVIGFGAEQVVLVRDGSLKEKVVDMIGKNALVLTIMESKGLEFQDVLLYDFFTTSAFSNEWRIIYEYMKEKGLPNLPSAVPSLSFNKEKHAVLCSELKQLYVAITRTRQRLWISETTGFCLPIYDYWKKLSLVEVKHLSDSFADKMQIPSNEGEWKVRGVKLFFEKNFRMARMCFLKAGDKYSERLSEAYHLRAIADSTRASQLERKKLLKDAAMVFSSVGKNELAAECFYEVEDYRTAGDIYRKESMLEKAGNCFSLAKCYELAAEVYEQAGAYTKSLSACANGKLFEIGFQLICRWGRCGDTEQEFLNKGALYYFAVKDFKRMMKFVRSFCSKDEMRSFLNKKKCLDELIFLEIEWRNFEVAAKVARLKPDPMLEADLLRMGGLHRESSLIISWHVFSNSPSFQSAEAHEKAEDFAECLSACADGKLFEIGFQLIGRWGGCGDHAELEFLHKGALYYFGVKDFKSMMKFVRSFHSKGEMRTFLTKKRCLDELISLETEWGNFEEAVKVARLKPDPVLEADLLCRCGLHKESSLVILWHVFLNSPIFQNSDEQFTHKDELLMKAVSIAKNDSDFFYQFVCKEAEILSKGETEEDDLLKRGLEFIYCYKRNALAVSLERVKKAREIEKIEKDVLDMLRSFFKSVNCHNELRLLEEVHGEFVEAAKIGEDDHSIEAALSRLWYVFFGSLWACGKRAWPLKDFKQKDKLLKDAESYVECHPDSQDYALVHTEISVLSNVKISLSQMGRYLRETPRERSLRIRFVISRKILDAHLDSCCTVNAFIDIWNENGTMKHLEDVLSKDIVSVEGLIYFWNRWKELILELINWGQGGKGSKVNEDFIFNYFGMRKYDRYKNGCYVVLDAEAQWVKQMNPSMLRNGYLYIIHAREFSSVASRYWCSELLFVAEKVLRKLHCLHAYSTVKNFSMHQQTKILYSLFEVAESLQKCKLPYGWYRANRIVDRSFQLCLDQFWSNVFHINWKIAQSKEMMSLRGNEMFLNMLEEAIKINSKSQKGLTCGQLGRIAMTFLGSRMIGLNDDTKRKVRGCSSMNWRDLFDKLNGDHGSSSKNGDLAIGLHNVLKETRLCAGWRRVDGCMSAACFLYLMERLMMLSFCFHGYVFTTRSSCVEWLAYMEWSMGSNGPCVTCLETMQNTHHSLALMVSEILNSQDDLLEWVTRSKEEESYAILVLRFTVLLSMICANSGQHYVHLFDLLGRSHIVSLLPSAFRDALIKGIKEDNMVNAVAVGCQEIDNPLVIMSFTEDFLESPCQNAIFLNMTKLDSRRETLIKVLYSESNEDAATCIHNCVA